MTLKYEMILSFPNCEKLILHHLKDIIRKQIPYFFTHA